MKRKKYIICTPSHSSSNGLRVLLLLAKELQARGEQVFLFSAKPNPKGFTCIEEITDEMRKNDIIVYPEVIFGNPLGFQNVVRYVLYFPGRNSGPKNYHHSEMIFVHDRSFLNKGEILTLPWLDTKIFYDNKSSKTQDCYFIHKGGKWRKEKKTRGLLEINTKTPNTREKLADLLRSTNILYSYDDCSALLDEALLCGCKVKVITKTGIEDFKSDYLEKIKDSKQNVSNFIDITQNSNYTGPIEVYKIKKKVIWIVKIFIYKYLIKNKNKLNKYELLIKGISF